MLKNINNLKVKVSKHRVFKEYKAFLRIEVYVKNDPSLDDDRVVALLNLSDYELNMGFENEKNVDN